ncbi:MAG TPA: aminotransferase class I/II-fold pyridoxal phosphate-dependent enzyme [Bryobacteraceae bacterium]|nr:aminotransferase class I/II-fold pyridoxal phosphate-dependent enzyme [Bryobacteraceae bacterium]
MTRIVQSHYMHWAKTHQHARFNLATSGMASVPISEFPCKLEDLELSRGGSYGWKPLQEALARHSGVSEENVVAAAGTSMANFVAMAALVEPGDEVLVEHPTYELLLSTLGFLQARIRRFPRRAENQFAIDPAEIPVTPQTRLIAITNLHNPSSALIPESTLRQIGAIAQRAGAHVLVDEVYLDAAFEQAPSSAFHLGPEFVITNSLTKVYGLSGLRCGWILAEPELAQRMWRMVDLFDVNESHPAERLSRVAFAFLGKFRARARAVLETNRQVWNAFAATRKDLVDVTLPFGTTAFPKLLTGPVDQFCEFLRGKYETSVVPGHFFEMPDRFRVGFGGSAEELREGLKRLASALDEFALESGAGC